MDDAMNPTRTAIEEHWRASEDGDTETEHAIYAVHHHRRRRADLLSLHHGICSRVGSARDAVLRRHLQCTCVAGSTCGADAGQAHRKGMIASFESVGVGGDSPLSDIVGSRSWLGRVRPRRRWRRRRRRSSEPGLCFRRWARRVGSADLCRGRRYAWPGGFTM
jgi:hypothetical protein